MTLWYLSCSTRSTWQQQQQVEKWCCYAFAGRGEHEGCRGLGSGRNTPAVVLCCCQAGCPSGGGAGEHRSLVNCPSTECMLLCLYLLDAEQPADGDCFCSLAAFSAALINIIYIQHGCRECGWLRRVFGCCRFKLIDRPGHGHCDFKHCSLAPIPPPSLIVLLMHLIV